jgi:HEAT repeat protein
VIVCGRPRLAALCIIVVGLTAPAQLHGQPAMVLSQQVVADLGSDDSRVRLRAAQRLKETPYDEAALPLARAIVDADDAVQMEAIGAELNIFLVGKVVPRRRVGLIVEVRNSIAARSIFEEGSAAVDPRPIPDGVLAALRTAAHDEHPRVAVEALYAFGALAGNAYGPARAALLAASAPDLAAPLGSSETPVRAAALRVVARVYSWRPGDPGLPQALGDAVVTMLNDRSFEVRMAATEALGAMRYERAVQALTDIYEHYQRGAAASAAMAALARVAHPASESLFAAALASRDSAIRTAAIEGLARSGAVSQAAAISSAVENDRNDDVQLAARFANVMLADGPMDDLVEGLTHLRTRARALQYLAESIPGRTELLAVHMPDPDPAVRVDLLEAVGLSGDPAALSLVDRVREDTDPSVARAVQRATARLGEARPAQP